MADPSEPNILLSEKTICKQVIKEIAAALDSDTSDISKFTELIGGKTNYSFLFSCKDKQYIVRIPGEGTDCLVSRTQEAEVYHSILGKNLCDDPVYLNPDNGLMIKKYIKGARPCDPHDPSDVKKCMELLRCLHNKKIIVSHNFDPFERADYYESLWDGRSSSHTDYEQTKINVFSLKPFIEKYQHEPCLAHIDAVPGNFLFYPSKISERLQLTDWEYAGMHDPHIDVAMFSLSSHYDRNHIEALIDTYFQGTCDRETRIKMYCYISICGLLWSNWAEYKQLLGVRLGDYAEIQYKYAKDYYDIARTELDQPFTIQ